MLPLIVPTHIMQELDDDYVDSISIDPIRYRYTEAICNTAFGAWSATFVVCQYSRSNSLQCSVNSSSRYPLCHEIDFVDEVRTPVS